MSSWLRLDIVKNSAKYTNAYLLYNYGSPIKKSDGNVFSILMHSIEHLFG